MISVLTRAEEEVVQDLAYVAGGEAALKAALVAFHRDNGRSPTGEELLRFVARRRLEQLREEEPVGR
jgi:hypothetical protein